MQLFIYLITYNPVHFEICIVYYIIIWNKKILN